MLSIFFGRLLAQSVKMIVRLEDLEDRLRRCQEELAIYREQEQVRVHGITSQLTIEVLYRVAIGPRLQSTTSSTRPLGVERRRIHPRI